MDNDDIFRSDDDRHRTLFAQRSMVKFTEFYVRLAEKKLGYKLGMPKILFQNIGRTAGRAICGRNTVIYNPHYVARNSEDMITNTTGHEVAHLVGHNLTGISGHGREWERVMWAFSLEATRCHNYDQVNAGTIKTSAVIQVENKIVKAVSNGINIVRFED